jgi:hypothetical protein
MLPRYRLVAPPDPHPAVDPRPRPTATIRSRICSVSSTMASTNRIFLSRAAGAGDRGGRWEPPEQQVHPAAILEALRKVYGAGNLIEELTLAPRRCECRPERRPGLGKSPHGCGFSGA